MQWAAQRPAEALAPMVSRTRYFDDFLKRATSSSSIRQVVLLAAGLDARAYRLPWPEQTTVFELDQSAVLLYKDEVLRSAGARPACTRQAIAADIAGDWTGPLSRAGFHPDRPTCWLLEGILFYLPSEIVESLLAAVSRLSPQGCWLGRDVAEPRGFVESRSRASVAGNSSPGWRTMAERHG
jgi:methyltransferase (TIGR00027 family)